MRFGFLAIAVAAAAAGASVGYYAGAERSGVSASTAARTVTVRKTVVAMPARPNPRAGKRVFTTACSRCHALKPVGWSGPRINLVALQPSYRAVVEKVKRGGIAMPSFARKLSARQIRDVAAYVAAETSRRERGAP